MILHTWLQKSFERFVRACQKCKEFILNPDTGVEFCSIYGSMNRCIQLMYAGLHRGGVGQYSSTGRGACLASRGRSFCTSTSSPTSSPTAQCLIKLRQPAFVAADVNALTVPPDDSHLMSAVDVPPSDEVWHVESCVSHVEAEEGRRTEQVVLKVDVTQDITLLSVKRSANSIVDCASWDTLQVGRNEHAKFGKKALKLNHSQDPNTRINIVYSDDDPSKTEKVEVVSTRAIAAGTPLSFNYNTTEWVMSEPFVDWVSEVQVGGFSNASTDEKRFLLQQPNLVAPHIRQMAAEAEAEAKVPTDKIEKSK